MVNVGCEYCEINYYFYEISMENLLIFIIIIVFVNIVK